MFKLFACFLLVASALGQDCGGLLQQCCCEAEDYTMQNPPDRSSQFMMGLPAQDQSGCCQADNTVCVASGYRWMGNTGIATNFKCQPKSIVTDATYVEPNSNYKGDFVIVVGTDNLQPSIEDCEASCKEIEACNVYVYCPLEDGCNNADIDVIPYQSCDLKVQQGIKDGQPPEAWSTGANVDFTSGYIERSIGCGYKEGAACCPTQLVLDSKAKLPGGCSTGLYCDYSSKDEDFAYGYCKQIDKSSVCGAEYGLCDSVCNGYESSCPEGFACGPVPFSGTPGFSLSDTVNTYCIEDPDEGDCGEDGQMCCPVNARDPTGYKQINAECNNGNVCVGADNYYYGNCVDYTKCGMTNGKCCPNLYRQTRNGEADNWDMCKDLQAWCNGTICQMNTDNCGVEGAACCWDSPSVSSSTGICNDGLGCQKAFRTSDGPNVCAV